MTPIKLLASGIDVSGINWSLECAPQLWDENTQRTAPESSPHHGLSDIWVRFAPDGVDGSQPHDSEWRIDNDILPVRDLVYNIMQLVQGDKLGGVLITRIPPGATCKPHTDPGWHARHYQKFAVQLKSSPGQAFHFEGVSLESKPGDLFWFDNSHLHWVTNDSAYDRVTMIVCIKTDKEF